MNKKITEYDVPTVISALGDTAMEVGGRKIEEFHIAIFCLQIKITETQIQLI